MDNLTHSLVGVMLARAGLDRTHAYADPNDPASLGAARKQRFTLMMVLAANVPDIDGFPFFYDPLEYLEIHRGPTHAFFFLPLMALLPIAVVWAVNRRRPSALLYWWFASMIAVASHLLLDWTNVYGIRMLSPFSGEWLHLDMTNLIDPFIWLILLVALAAPALSGLVSQEIAGRARAPKLAWAWVALVALTGYEGYRWISHEQALATLDSRLYNGAPAEQVYAFPNGLLPTTWRAIVRANAEGKAVVYETQLNLRESYDPSNAKAYYPADPERNPAIRAALTTRPFQVLRWFDQAPFWRVTRSGAQDPASPVDQELESVDLIDMRFGSPSGGGGFSAHAIVDRRGNVLESTFGLGGGPLRSSK